MPYHYTNRSDRIQIITITCQDQFVERVVFPKQILNFDAKDECYLEIHNYNPVTMILADRIKCDRLCN